MIIRGAFGTPLTQHHRRQHCLQHASQAYLSSFKINACAQLRIIINNARRFYFQDLRKQRCSAWHMRVVSIRMHDCAWPRSCLLAYSRACKVSTDIIVTRLHTWSQFTIIAPHAI